MGPVGRHVHTALRTVNRFEMDAVNRTISRFDAFVD